MYLDYFGLREYPFALTPDTSFFFDYASHVEALNVLQLALRSGEGFIKVTGEVGLGKTLLCRRLLASLDEQFVTAYVPDPQLSAFSVRNVLAEELGVATAPSCSVMRRVRHRLMDIAGEGRRVVLIIDEAQQLPAETLEAVRLLSNLETEKFKLLQVVTFGQPELDRRLAHPSLRQLRQRISFSYCLAPLDRRATRDYIVHRLEVAGHTGGRLFADGAVGALYRASRGTPRLVNILSHKALLAAYGRDRRSVGRTEVRRAIRDTEGLQRSWHPRLAT